MTFCRARCLRVGLIYGTKKRIINCFTCSDSCSCYFELNCHFFCVATCGTGVSRLPAHRLLVHTHSRQAEAHVVNTSSPVWRWEKLVRARLRARKAGAGDIISTVDPGLSHGGGEGHLPPREAISGEKRSLRDLHEAYTWLLIKAQLMGL